MINRWKFRSELEKYLCEERSAEEDKVLRWIENIYVNREVIRAQKSFGRLISAKKINQVDKA